MSQFRVDRKQEGEALVLQLHGQIDEDASFNDISFEGSKNVILDLTGVESINSCGIREWIKWIKTAPAGARIEYRNCPKIIVDQINMVSGFLPDNAKVRSFFVPYFCESTGAEKMVLFTEGKEFTGGGVNPPQGIKDDDTGDEMEMDVIEAKYFKFLKSA